MKQAILVTSFGTTHSDTLEKTILPTEAALANAFSGWTCRRAFTSKTVRRKLQSEQNLPVDSAEEALEKLRAEGFQQVVIQPTLLVPGLEYDRLQAVLQKYPDWRLSMGKPLLSGEADLPAMVKLLTETYPAPKDQLVLFMGHGTYQPTKTLYEQLAKMLPQTTGGQFHLCTVEGTPTFADGIREVCALPQRKIRLVPMLLVAGDHAKNDMAGSQPESLRSLLEAQGFSVECSLQGLGELEPIRQWYVRRAREAAEAL